MSFFELAAQKTFYGGPKGAYRIKFHDDSLRYISTKLTPSSAAPFKRVQSSLVLTVKMNFFCEDNKVCVNFTEVWGCTDFVNNIAVDVFFQCAYAAWETCQYPTIHL